MMVLIIIIAMRSTNSGTFLSFNCKGLSRSMDCIRNLCQSADIIALQETWLLQHDIPLLGTIDADFAYAGNTAVDLSAGVLRGRPYGGVALLWRKSLFPCVSLIQCKSVRLIGIKVSMSERSMIIFSVYMPTDERDNMTELIDCLGEICAIIDSEDVDLVYLLGDYNAHPDMPFYNELKTFCSEQQLSVVDSELLPADSYTYVSDSHGCRRWLDHCVTSSAAKLTVSSAKIHYGVFWSDHFPLEIVCNLDNNVPKKCVVNNNNMKSTNLLKNVVWGEREQSQINNYHKICHSKLKYIDFPQEMSDCCDNMCKNLEHRTIIDKLYTSIVTTLVGASVSSCSFKKPKKGGYVTGWNKHVHMAHKSARLCFQEWSFHGKPRSGRLYEAMCSSRKEFKSKLKFCLNNKDQIKMDIIAAHHKSKNFAQFWKSTKKLSPKVSLPVSVDGVSGSCDIANLFGRHFKVEPLLQNKTVEPVLAAENLISDNPPIRVTAAEIAMVIKQMTRGKSPGHDGLSIEHLQYAGVHLPRVLSMFYTFCIRHNYLPADLMKTVVVPLIKNKTGDASDKSNYRPISLATVLAKVLDSVLNKYLNQHVSLHDAQFGFRQGLSTESAVLCLKHTVRYYTDRNTPIFACFLDLSKAFDLVSYNVLWEKMRTTTTVPTEISNVLKYWYGNQDNCVRWDGEYSDDYKLKCGVRQGWLTSPTLFNLYINGLIEGLSSAGVGCSIDGCFVNNINYADDMVLLCPSLNALNLLLKLCEKYAAIHGLQYNVKKSEILVFKSGAKTYSMPPITLCGVPLQIVTKFKYLGHWITDNLADDVDMERERRALSVRSNMLSRRYARCSRDVKISLFKAYCQTLYTCNLWSNYTKKSYSALRVQYNNAFRGLLGLPWRCSASGMFAASNTDGFQAVIRKRVASLWGRVKGSTNTLLRVIAEKVDSPMLKHWTSLHVTPNINYQLY